MKSHYVAYKNSTIHYRQFGDGPKLLFCFHGYGRDSDTFYILERKLGPLFTIIAIDFPFHGRTEWKDEMVVRPEYLQQLLLQIRSSLQKENIKFSLLGFSMGGRIALHIAQLMPDSVERLVLLAPDGLNFNMWRWAASDTWLGNKLVNYTMHNAKWIEWILNKAEKRRVINSSLAEVVRYYLDDDKHRLMFYHKYVSMRKFKPSLARLKRLITKYKIPVKMMFGRFDRVIPFAGGERFKAGMEAFVSVKIAETGHHLLSEMHVDEIVQMITA